MLRTAIQILFVFLTSVLLNLIYQVFYTYPKYNGTPALFFPKMEYPSFVLLTFVLGFIFGKFIMKSKVIWALALALIVAFCFTFIANSIENKFGYVYDHYYKRTPFTNLTHLNEYGSQIDNRLTLGKALKEIGVKANSIHGGYTEKGPLAKASESYIKKVYHVNDEIYIIFDWDKEKITAYADYNEMLKILYEGYDKFNGIHSNVFYSEYGIILRNEDNLVTGNLKIFPTNEGTFEFFDE